MRQFYEAYCDTPIPSTLFLTELGSDFCFIGSEFPLQVGGTDFALDLLFYHRRLNSLVAIELKITEFQPEHLGKLNFYLEALDRAHRKAYENPAAGVLLCASKDDEVVEYALSRSLSAASIFRIPTRPAAAYTLLSGAAGICWC